MLSRNRVDWLLLDYLLQWISSSFQQGGPVTGYMVSVSYRVQGLSHFPLSALKMPYLSNDDNLVKLYILGLDSCYILGN